MENVKKWDAFLCHASEDKDVFVRPLVVELEKRGFKVWYDEFCLRVGDSLRESIERGLVSSRYGIVVLSHFFFEKEWPQKELSTLVAQESKTARNILPVWFEISHADVLKYAPLLADRVAARSDQGFEKVLEQVVRVLNVNIPSSSFPSFDKFQEASSFETKILAENINWKTITEFTFLRFAEWGIDEFWQRQLLADLDCLRFKTISDIDKALIRAAIPLALYACEKPAMFKTGTDFITKAIGFVDSVFRQRHNFASVTLEAFKKYSHLIRNDLD